MVYKTGHLVLHGSLLHNTVQSRAAFFSQEEHVAILESNEKCFFCVPANKTMEQKG